MKTFLRNIVIFLLPVALTIGWLFTRDYNKAFAYHYISGDCSGRGAWIYEKIFSDTVPVDIAFIGSSRTIHSVNDSLLNVNFNIPGRERIRFLNLGYCRYGRNLDYLIIEELIKRKKPKLIVLEIRNGEEKFSHPMFPYLADAGVLLNQSVLFDRDYFPDATASLAARWDFLRYQLGLFQINTENAYSSPNGFWHSSLVANPVRLKPGAWKSGKGNFFYDYNVHFPMAWMKKIYRITSDRNVPLAFIYLPGYTGLNSLPDEFEAYKRYGEVMIPPVDKISNKQFWEDNSHFNDYGAALFTDWVEKKLKDEGMIAVD